MVRAGVEQRMHVAVNRLYIAVDPATLAKTNPNAALSCSRGLAGVCLDAIKAPNVKANRTDAIRAFGACRVVREVRVKDR
jgi:hypothetical protein